MDGLVASVFPSTVPWLKGGGDYMEGPTPELEVERVMNLVRGFGWEKVQEEIIDDEIFLKIKKKSAGAAVTGPGPGPS
ncbi:hypothetical protein ES702_06244 [subsurface metagenome]